MVPARERSCARLWIPAADVELLEERAKGRAVLLVSLELEEIRSLSDRVLVIYEGEIVAEMSPEASEEDFGVLMTGGGRGEEAVSG